MRQVQVAPIPLPAMHEGYPEPSVLFPGSRFLINDAHPGPEDLARRALTGSLQVPELEGDVSGTNLNPRSLFLKMETTPRGDNANRVCTEPYEDSYVGRRVGHVIEKQIKPFITWGGRYIVDGHTSKVIEKPCVFIPEEKIDAEDTMRMLAWLAIPTVVSMQYKMMQDMGLLLGREDLDVTMVAVEYPVSQSQDGAEAVVTALRRGAGYDMEPVRTELEIIHVEDYIPSGTKLRGKNKPKNFELHESGVIPVLWSDPSDNPHPDAYSVREPEYDGLAARRTTTDIVVTHEC